MSKWEDVQMTCKYPIDVISFDIKPRQRLSGTTKQITRQSGEHIVRDIEQFEIKWRNKRLKTSNTGHKTDDGKTGCEAEFKSKINNKLEENTAKDP